MPMETNEIISILPASTLQAFVGVNGRDGERLQLNLHCSYLQGKLCLTFHSGWKNETKKEEDQTGHEVSSELFFQVKVNCSHLGSFPRVIGSGVLLGYNFVPIDVEVVL